MIFNEICNNIIETGMLEFQNEMASFSDYSLYTGYLTEATASSDNKKKNILVRAFDAIIRMFTKLGEKIQSLFSGREATAIDNAVSNLKKSNQGKNALSKKREFKVFKNTKKLDSETAERLLKAKSTDEIERIMKSYRKQRNATIKIVSVAIGAVAAISTAKYISHINSEIKDVTNRAERYKKTIATLTKKLDFERYKSSKAEEKHKKATNHIRNASNIMKAQKEFLNYKDTVIKRQEQTISNLNANITEISNDFQKKLSEALGEVSKNQAQTIKEEATQQKNFYSYVMKLSKASVKNKDFDYDIPTASDISKMGMTEVSAAMNKLKQLRTSIKNNNGKISTYTQMGDTMKLLEERIKALRK